ncbi:hypothetical protein CR969_01215 [Candidatus Saccharibacteria bacterium]|nr:MAG: hypothetical protein CR969_01215 [Candidatus Saccharibacteria bacterium]
MKYSRARNNFSRFVPILLVAVITIVAIAAVIAIGRAILGGDQQPNNNQSAVSVDEGREALLSTDISRSVRLTVRGPIVANEKHRSYQITVSPDSRVMATYEGYLEKQLDSKELSNNSRAYEELVYALDKRKMMEGRELTEEQNDLRGICASGKVYKMETLLNGDPVKTLWTSDCGGSKGSAVANVNEVLDMFIKQIPDGKKMAASVGLTQKDTFFRL